MSDAYRCDACGEFETGRPTETLYRKESDRSQNTEYREVYHLCQSCHEDMGADDGDD